MSFLSFSLDGQAQVLLKQTKASITKSQRSTARIECAAEGIPNFQNEYIHWYRHIPSKGPERILYITSAPAFQISYDDNSYRSKYSALKRGENVCIFEIKDVNSNDEGTYYCAYWEDHRMSRPQAAGTESCPRSELAIKCRGRTTVAPSCL